ncbi:hypothetical protein llap_22866 [Limosa lapponica baueri]|uniref:Uncharacterized protein n=1 Tax=Limosa lapponica baueri TaxID=1758121 RepID=A0A2I0SZ49_LIMLA|nr:hypothetical protein llap_22866 [Limosa lapponica baueri]
MTLPAIYIDELYGGLQKPNEDEKKKLAEKKASIGYTYEDSTVAELENSLEKRGEEEDSEEDSNTDEDEVIPDIGNGAVSPPAWADVPWPLRAGACAEPPVLCPQTWKWTWTS